MGHSRVELLELQVRGMGGCLDPRIGRYFAMCTTGTAWEVYLIGQASNAREKRKLGGPGPRRMHSPHLYAASFA